MDASTRKVRAQYKSKKLCCVASTNYSVRTEMAARPPLFCTVVFNQLPTAVQPSIIPGHAAVPHGCGLGFCIDNGEAALTPDPASLTGSSITATGKGLSLRRDPRAHLSLNKANTYTDTTCAVALTLSNSTRFRVTDAPTQQFLNTFVNNKHKRVVRICYELPGAVAVPGFDIRNDDPNNTRPTADPLCCHHTLFPTGPTPVNIIHSRDGENYAVAPALAALGWQYHCIMCEARAEPLPFDASKHDPDMWAAVHVLGNSAHLMDEPNAAFTIDFVERMNTIGYPCVSALARDNQASARQLLDTLRLVVCMLSENDASVVLPVIEELDDLSLN